MSHKKFEAMLTVRFTAAGSTITKDVPAQALGIARDRQTNLEGWAEPKMEAYIAKKKKLEDEQSK